MGLKSYITNIPSTISPGAEIISRHHELQHAEWSFRMSEHDLKTRPIFQHARDPIHAHLTLVAVPLVISRYLPATTGITIPKSVDTFVDLQEINITLLNGNTHTARLQITEETRAIFELLGH